MSEPYIMEWYPEDGGYASLAIHSFDTLSGTLDGINSAGLAVSILADNEAMWELGPKLEPHLGPQQAIGLHELALMRLLLDTCATVAEAEEALLTIKQYYRIAPLHYIVARHQENHFWFKTLGKHEVLTLPSILGFLGVLVPWWPGILPYRAPWHARQKRVC